MGQKPETRNLRSEILRVLLIEDNPGDARLIREMLADAAGPRSATPSFELICDERLSAGLEHLATEEFNVILLDLSLPDSQGLDTFVSAHTRAPDLPIVVLTGLDDETFAIEAAQRGAQDYLVKGQVNSHLLARAIYYAIERKRREREREVIVTVANALRTASTRADMLPIILDQLLDLLQADGAALAMRAPASSEIVFELARGVWAKGTGVHLAPGEGVTGHVMDTGRPYRNNDIQTDPRVARPELFGDLNAAACAPLIAQEQTIGALWVGCKTAIDNEALRLLTAVGDMAANAIHRATLHEQTERRLQRLAALREIDRTIMASTDLRITLSVLLDQVTARLEVDAADVLLLNPHTQTLEYAAGRGFHTDAIARTQLRLGEGYAGRAVLERDIVSISDMTTADDFVRTQLVAEDEFRVYYSVPLIAKGQVKGVLEIFHRKPLDPNPEWLDFLEALAAQTAIAINNAELFDDLQRSNAELTLAYNTTLEGWARALELRDMETEGHSRRVTQLTVRLARAMGMNKAELAHVRRGALLHDIGKMGVPDRVLFKPGPLTDEEWDIIHQHPVHAYEMLAPIRFLRPALDIPYCHHEKWDGTGYPRGLKGEQIPLPARIFAVVDVYDALTSDRPYREAWSEEKTLEYIQEQAGEHFDPQVVEVFLEEIEADRPEENRG